MGTHLNDLRSQWRIRDVRLVLSASFVNSLGTGLYLASYALYALRSDVGAEQLSLALSIGGVVALLSAPIGAKSAERYGSLRLTVLLNIGRGLATLALVVSSSYVFALVIFVLTVLDRFAFPATQTVLAAVSAKGDRSVILSSRQLTQTLGTLCGAGIAGLLQLAASNDSLLSLLVAANGLSFLANALMYSRLPSETGPPRKQPLPWRVGWPARSMSLLLVASIVLDSGGLIVSLGFPLVLVTTKSALVTWVGALVAVETGVGVVTLSLIGKYVKTSSDAAGALVIGALTSVGACLLLGFLGTDAAGVLVTASVALGIGSTLASYSVYFFVIEEASPDFVSRHLAAYGVAGSTQRVITPWVLTGLALAASSLYGWCALAVLLLLAGGVAFAAARAATRLTQPLEPVADDKHA